jgi:hypothetical protein
VVELRRSGKIPARFILLAEILTKSIRYDASWVFSVAERPVAEATRLRKAVSIREACLEGSVEVSEPVEASAVETQEASAVFPVDSTILELE